MRSQAIAALKRVGLHGVAVGSYVRLVNGVRWVRARPERIAAHARWRAGARDRRRVADRYRGILRSPLNLELMLGEVTDDSLAIVVCLWNRPERLEKVLRLVDAQTTARRLRLVLWNNQPTDADRYRATIAAHSMTGALASVEFHTSANIGGIARFVAMRELVRRGYDGTFIMLDDDENVSPTFVDDLLALAGPRTLAGVWAWLSTGKYWNRVQVEATGSAANHIGTGGAAVDSAIVRSERFFTDIPADFLFMEDMWMSRCALNSGWSLVAVASPVEFVLAELDQGHAIFDHKEKFWRWMSRPSRIPQI